MATYEEKLVAELRELKIKMAWLEINNNQAFQDVEKLKTDSWLAKMGQVDDERISHVIEHLELELNEL